MVNGLIILLAIILIYYIWSRPEYLTDDEIAQSLIAKAILGDPQDSTAVIEAMPYEMQKKFEHMVSLPFNPNYYKKSRETMEDKFQMSLYA